MNALLLENPHPQASSLLEKSGLNIRSVAPGMGEDELIEALAGVHVLGIRSRTHVTERVLQNAPDLLAVGAYCIGTNQIDLSAASRSGIAVFNAPYSNTRSVAELVIGEIIFLIRKLFDKSVKAHQGVWDKSAAHAHEVRGKRLGIIGYGNIGSQVSMLAEAMGMEVMYFDVVDKLTIGNAKRTSNLDELLSTSDIITIHVDGNVANSNLIDEREFSLMKEGVILLNLSRGHVVNVNVLAERIKSGAVGGAAVDVFPEEPKGASDPLHTPLQGLPNVLLTPHIGGSTEEAQEHIAEFVSSKLLEYVFSGNTFTSVNFPKINVPKLEDDQLHRLLHVHHNVPGVLSQINGIFAKNNVNVLSQSLRTNELIGYVVADVDKNYNDSLFEDLKNVAHTVCVRII